jgi:hypothetical protein
MPKKPVVLASLSELYRTAFDSCVVLWPVFILRIVFLFLNLAFLALCLTIGFMPVIQFFMEHFADINGGNFKNIFSQMDILSWFGYSQALIIAFYITCAVFFLAFFDGAVYNQMNRQQKEGANFYFGNFFMDGLKKTMPMMGLIFIWLFGGFLVFFAAIFTAAFLGMLVGKLLPWWIDVFLALPVGLAGLLMALTFLTAASLSAAYLVDGRGIWGSIKEAFEKAIKHKCRAVLAMLLLWLIYLVFFIAFTVVFTVLAYIPVVGILFVMIKFLVTSVLAIGFNIYMTSLSVALQLEPKESR